MKAHLLSYMFIGFCKPKAGAGLKSLKAISRAKQLFPGCAADFNLPLNTHHLPRFFLSIFFSFLFLVFFLLFFSFDLLNCIGGWSDETREFPRLVAYKLFFSFSYFVFRYKPSPSICVCLFSFSLFFFFPSSSSSFSSIQSHQSSQWIFIRSLKLSILLSPVCLVHRNPSHHRPPHTVANPV